MTAPAEYCTVDDVRSGTVPANTISMIADSVILSQIRRASSEATGFLSARYPGLPLISWGYDLRGWVADIVALRVLRYRGMNPEDPANALIVKAHDDGMKALREVANGTRTLDVTQTGSEPSLEPDVTCDPPRDLEIDDPGDQSRRAEFWR